MQEKKKSKFWNAFLWVGISILTIGASIGAGYGFYILLNKDNEQSDSSTFSYNNNFRDLKTEFEKAKNVDEDKRTTEQKADIAAYNFYNKYTRSIQIIDRLTNKVTLGTAWAYPKNFVRDKDDSRYYFATNIHVINQNLKIDSQGNIYFDTQPSVVFYDKKNNATRLNDVRLEHISYRNNDQKFTDQINVNNQNAPVDNVYTDYAVLSTNISPWGDEKGSAKQLELDFATPDEVELIANPSKDVNDQALDYIYIAGYPGAKSNNQNFSYANVKINVKELRKAKVTTSPLSSSDDYKLPYSSSRLIFPSNSTTVIPPKKDDPINTEPKIVDAYLHAGMSLDGKYNYGSYANELIIPGLNIGAGSSGSVFTTYVNGKLKILGIWWGAYEINKSDDKRWWDGCASLFYSNDYKINQASPSLQKGYDNRYTNRSSLNIHTNNF